MIGKRKLDWEKVNTIIDTALLEDIEDGDITTDTLFDKSMVSGACLRAKGNGIIAGLAIARAVFERAGNSITWNELKNEGQSVKSGDILVVFEGSVRQILIAERIALNILQRLSGIATATAMFVKEVEGHKAKIVDTRKTVPGLRVMEKYAVTVGGGYNHRMGLFDGVMIKDNHIRMAGSIKKAVSRIREKHGSRYTIEVETTDHCQVVEALESGADIIMLDNMSAEKMRETVELVRGRALLEASGGITLDRVREIAETGVDLISVGALTHSVKALDISLDML